MNCEYEGYYLVPVAMNNHPDGGLFDDTFAFVHGIGKIDALFRLQEHPDFGKTFTTRNGRVERYSALSLQEIIEITD